ncbi:hypothetical protein C8R43DRAFT_942440 [Mycena crocata]|nr:hypothetical protein C8R43DRAFT_942440 [Mycena crocata]
MSQHRQGPVKALFTGIKKEEEERLDAEYAAKTGAEYADPTAGMSYQPIFALPVGFADMTGMEQLCYAGIDLTPQSVLDAFKKHPVFSITAENESAVLSDIRQKIDDLKISNFELVGVAPTASQARTEDNVFWVTIPGMPEYVLRFYPGGKQLPEQLGTFFMDVCDSQTEEPVVVPENFVFIQHATPGTIGNSGKMETLESHQWRVTDHPPRDTAPAQEKFSFYQGAVCELQIDDSFVMSFHVPFYPASGAVAHPLHVTKKIEFVDALEALCLGSRSLAARGAVSAATVKVDYEMNLQCPSFPHVRFGENRTLR